MLVREKVRWGSPPHQRLKAKEKKGNVLQERNRAGGNRDGELVQENTQQKTRNDEINFIKT